VYELRLSSFRSAGGLMLAPNALRILDSIGVYSRLGSKGHNFEVVQFRNEHDQVIDQFYMGSKDRYGFQALRIPRQVVLDELRRMVEERNIPLYYQKKFAGVVDESDNHVSFHFTDGSSGKASILVGADGIHSAVREFVCPDVAPIFSGQLAIGVTVQRTLLRFSDDKGHSLPAVFHGKSGGFLMLPQSFDGSEIMMVTQRAYMEQDRAGWDRLAIDKDLLVTLFRMDYAEWPDIVRSALENIRPDNVAIWPYYSLPKLSRWTSLQKRVILIGDAAHAIPPTAGQGACQAFEDSKTLSTLLENVPLPGPLEEGLEFWENSRKSRIDKVALLTVQLGNNRLPQEQREKLPKGQYWNSSEQPDLRWLYETPVGDDISFWCRNRVDT